MSLGEFTLLLLGYQMILLSLLLSVLLVENLIALRGFNTVLHYRNGYLDIVRCLVIGHCDPNIKDNVGWTPLHYACS